LTAPPDPYQTHPVGDAALRPFPPYSRQHPPFLRLPSSQWKSARITNAIKRLHEEFKRRIKTQTVLPSAETAAMLFWALLASGQITMRKVDGWQTLPEKLIPQCIDLAA
jgi:putative transposase